MRKRLLLKALLCVIGIFVLIYIAVTFHYKKIQDGNAPYIETEVVKAELAAMSDALENQVYDSLVDEGNNFKEEYLTFRDLKKITKQYPHGDISMFELYKGDDWYISQQDWNQYLDNLVSIYGNERIKIQDRLIVADGRYVVNEEKESLENGCIYTDDGIYNTTLTNIEDYFFSVVKIFTLDNTLISALEKTDATGILKNCYIVDSEAETAIVFHGGYYIYISQYMSEKPDLEAQGEIADISFGKGQVLSAEVKEEYINGKLLRATEDEIEIEGYGVYPLDENMQIYRLYKELCVMSRKDLRIGYEFTDFVLEDGKIAACLMMKEESMDNIRVLLRNANLESRYHENIEVSCNQDMEMITYLDGVETDRQDIVADEKVFFEKETFLNQVADGSYKRVKLVPKVLSGKIYLHSAVRSQGVPQYPGTMEITCNEDGFVVVNEVLLEDYLIRVVPSEMPSKYPMEALKSQAICARTYAYGKMVHTGLPALGAHVDDSASFQVYNNINAQSSTTEAVKATHNTILTYEDEPIQAYYYSTSAGCGTEATIWHSLDENPGYLTPREIGSRETDEFADYLKDEDVFDEYIRSSKDSHFESEEGWYRWTYVRPDMDMDRIQEILTKRYEQNPNLILTKEKDGSFVSKTVPKLGEITDIRVLKRLSGGVVDELLIEGTKATVKVISELNVRHVLSDGESKALRQTGDEVNATMLPSAYLSIDLNKEDDIVTGYTIYGGGFGHGVGMSQNGAKNMANNGMDYRDILDFFYPGSEVVVLESIGE